MQNILKAFEEDLISKEKSNATVEKYIRDAGAFLVWLNGEEVTKEKIIEYKDGLIKNYKTRSVNSIISSLNAFFEFINRYDLRLKAVKMQRETYLKKEKELTKKEYEILLNTAKRKGDDRLYYLMQAVCATGIRVSELRFITREAIDTKTAQINCKGKVRTVFLPKKLCNALKEYAKKRKIKSGSIFITKTGQPLDRCNIWKMLKAIAKAAGVDRIKVFPHNLRHLFARTFYNLQKDIVRLSDILGHSNINTTRIYTMENGDIHRMQIERLGLFRC